MGASGEPLTEAVEDDEAALLARRWRRVAAAVLALVVVIVLIGGAVALIAYRRQQDFGTVWADRAPPRISRCGRDWYKGSAVERDAALPIDGLAKAGTTPGGAAILTQAPRCTNPIDTVIWVQLDADHYVAYSLSGGP